MITSRQNETVKTIRRLRRSKGDHALLEGPHLVDAALVGGLKLETVLVTAKFAQSQAGLELQNRLPDPTLLVAPELLDQLMDADSPRGILGVVQLSRPALSELPPINDGFVLFLDGMQDPGNLGALARVAEAVAARAMVLGPGTASPNHARALRASAGSLLRLPVATATVPELSALGALSQAPWVGLLPKGGEDLYEAELDGPFILAVGSEGRGLASETSARLDRQLTIPAALPVQSLNATVAAAVVLFELTRRRA